MFRNLDEFLKSDAGINVDKNGVPTSKELKVSVLAVLAEMAIKDASFDPQELTRMAQVFFREYELQVHDTVELLEIVDYLKRNGKKLDDYLKLINNNFSVDQKISVLAMAWKIVLADGSAQKYETAFAADLRTRLGLTVEQAVRASKLALQEKLSLEPVKPSEG